MPLIKFVYYLSSVKCFVEYNRNVNMKEIMREMSLKRKKKKGTKHSLLVRALGTNTQLYARIDLTPRLLFNNCHPLNKFTTVKSFFLFLLYPKLHQFLFLTPNLNLTTKGNRKTKLIYIKYILQKTTIFKYVLSSLQVLL